MEYFIGIDIGGTKIAGGIVRADGVVLHRQLVPTPVEEGGPKILADAIAVAEALVNVAAAENYKIKAIGIGAGGQIDSEQGLVFSASDVLPGWRGLRITEAFEHALKLPARVENDVNALALGECRFGSAEAISAKGTVVFLALGTGVGGALVNAGRVHHGAHWSGGEFGHILLNTSDDARYDRGGSQGTLEAYCSGPGLVATYRDLLQASTQCIQNIDTLEIHGHDVVATADRELAENVRNGPGGRAIMFTGRSLGFGLVTLANALDPDMIIIGGGLAALGDRLLAPARAVLQERAMPGPATCPVVVASLGADASIIGAACVAM
ncbi:MAG: ROK family protein [Cyanobacteria bacterium REEB67]|nr:ROK family protein [Cyanobacteria bacterium REEB67]